MSSAKIKKGKNQITITVDSRIYPLEVVYGAAYVFLDKAYLYLDGDPKKKITITIKGKNKLSRKETGNLAREFLNELLNYSLRYQISKQNRKIREYIVGTALLGAVREEPAETEKEDWQKDSLGIAVPWEEKYKKK